MDQKFHEFSKFRESEKSLKHELGDVLLPVSLWYSDITSVSYTGDSGFKHGNPLSFN